jgi:HEPN domain-containing protein
LVGIGRVRFGTARYMLASSRFLYVVFLCHLTLEKALKAIITERTGHTPPRTHDLVGLIKLTGLILEQQNIDFVSKLNVASVPSRYPSDLREALTEYSRDRAESYFHQTEGVFTWLKQKLNLTK